jgi:hypothetical protein
LGFCPHPEVKKKIKKGKHTVQCTYMQLNTVLEEWQLNVLKVPKREIFVTELFILSDPIWVGDLRTETKKPFV